VEEAGEETAEGVPRREVEAALLAELMAPALVVL
jgi:hypothetical protein